MLVRSLGDTSVDNVVFVDEELPRLRAALPGVAVEQFYPAVITGAYRYANVERFKAETGVDFRTYLTRR
jgi:hypothetical protein